jgi:site-specific recombinase XerD
MGLVTGRSRVMSQDTSPKVSALRLRMIEDMRMRKLERRTQEGYIRGVLRLSNYLKRSPLTATAEDLRRFQLHLVEAGVSPTTLNATLTAVKFLYEVTLDRPYVVAKLRRVRVDQKLPVILSREEVALLIESAATLKVKTALTLAYGAGLRAGEVVALKTADVDSQRMVLRIEQAKGRKDRYAILSPLMLERLRAWWRYARSQNQVIEGGWLFPGQDRINPMTTRQLNRGIHDAARAAGLDKRVSMHSLRHAFATHLLEQKEDIRVIQVLLGHKKIDTTTVYTHVATEVLREVVSPIESPHTM